MENDAYNLLTNGSIRRGLFRLAGPMFASALLQNAQSLIDLFWVGRLGPDSVAALALSGTILFLMWPLAMGLGIGTVALVSRHTGAVRPDHAGAAAGQSLMLAVLCGIAVALVGIPLLPLLLNLTGSEPAVKMLAGQYMRISLAGYGTVFLLAIFTSAMQGVGNTFLPMLGMILANAVNMALDPVMIFGLLGFPALGVRGAALATVISQVAACLLMGVALARGIPHLRLAWTHLKLNLRLALELFRIGIFGSGQMLARSLMSLALFRIVSESGTIAQAGYGIGLRFHQIILLPCFVLGNASATLVGQNLGAGRPDRAVRGGWLATGFAMGINLAAACVLFLFAEPLTAFFTQDPAVIDVSSVYLRLVSPFYVFTALGIVLGRSVNGAGDTAPTMIITIATLWGVQVPLAYLLSRVFIPATTGVWWSIAAANTLNGILTALWFILGRWKGVSIRE